MQILLSLCEDDNDNDDDDDIYFVRELKFHFGECAVKLGTIQIQTRLRARYTLTHSLDRCKNSMMSRKGKTG